MSKGPTQVQETPQQKAMAEFATNQLADYKARWLPVQQHLASTVQESGAADSTTRRMASGKAATDTAIQFAGAQDKLTSTGANTVGLGSSRAKLAISGLGTDQARSKGLGAVAADQQVDDAYTQALGALTSIGKGESAQVASSMSNQASMSARQAQADAEASMATRAGNMQLVGQVAGFGLQQGGAAAIGKGVSGMFSSGGVSGTNDIKGVTGSNAMDMWSKFGSGGD